MSEPQLSNCPFCGGESELCSYEQRIAPDIEITLWYVRCVMAHCETIGRSWDTSEAAMAAWNRRAKPEAHVPPSKPVDDWLRKIEAKLGIAKEMEADE